MQLRNNFKNIRDWQGFYPLFRYKTNRKSGAVGIKGKTRVETRVGSLLSHLVNDFDLLFILYTKVEKALIF